MCRAQLWHHALIFWPYRPREGYPSVPPWLLILVLLAAIEVYLTLLTILSQFR